MYEQLYVPDYYVLEHHGILGQKWGVRRYQNADGSLTSAGEKRYEKLGRNYRRNTSFDDIRINNKKERVLRTTGGYKSGLFSEHHNKQVDSALYNSMRGVVSSTHKSAHKLAEMDDETGTNYGAQRFGADRIQGGDFSYIRRKNSIVGGIAGGAAGLGIGAVVGAAAFPGAAVGAAAITAISTAINTSAGVSIGEMYTDKSDKYANKRAHYNHLIDSYVNSMRRD